MPLGAIVSPSALVRGTQPVARSGAVATALTLSKARITGLIVLTGVVAALVATRGAADPAAIAWFAVAASLGSAGAAMLNHYLDRDLDACMERTRSRPLPAGAVSPRLVLGLGLGSLGTSLALAPLAHPRLPLWIGLGAVTYVVVYTWWLKRRTPLSVVIGGCTGSCAVLGGWEVGGAPLSLDAWALAATLFLWTPPHFWALALARIADYQDARVPTLPSVAGFERTARVVLVHAVATVAVASVPWLTGRLGLIALSGSLLSGAVWLWLLRRAHCEPTAQRWWAAYKMSGVYLLATLVSMLVDIGRG